MTHYTLFVDEAGDDKVSELKPYIENGNSEWLCIGGYLVKGQDVKHLAARRDAILNAIGGHANGVLHYRNLKPKNRFIATEMIARKEFSARGFIVCSCKATMLGYRNDRAAQSSGNPRDILYNWVVRLLLERVTEYVHNISRNHGITNPKIRVVMASRRGHHFGGLKAYISQLINQAIAGTTYQDTREIYADTLDWNQIYRAPASKDPGLQLADLVTSSFFQSIEQANPHYFNKTATNLKPLMTRTTKGSRENRTYRNMGVTVFPPKDGPFVICVGGVAACQVRKTRDVVPAVGTSAA